MKFSLLATVLTVISSCVATPAPTRTNRLRKRGPPPGFVATSGKNFVVDGQPLKFAGTNAYWMFLLNEESDIVDVFREYQQSHINVVRIWAFREAVGQPPAVGNYTQLWQNGKATCSPQGQARIKFILDTADSFGIKVVLALTNNWSVDFPASTLAQFPEGYFSNSYGGIDTFVQQISPGAHRDEFFTNDNIIAAYQDWLKCTVPTYKNHRAVFSWELANDPRCQGAQGTSTSSGCTTTTITNWVKQQAKFLKTLDPNHLTGAGDGGFQCTQSTCVKVNSINPPAPQTSPGVGSTDGTTQVNGKKKRRWLSTADVLARAGRSDKAARHLSSTDSEPKKMRIRGGWAAIADAPKTKRQESGGAGSAYNGFWGVDSQDICADPNIDFCSLQVFPDQDVYGLGQVTLTRRQSDSSPGVTDESIGDAVNFILNQASDSSKPTAALAVGVTSSSHSNQLNHFDSTNVGPNSNQNVASDSEQQTATSRISDTASSIQALFPWQQGHHHAHSKKGSVVKGSDSSSRKRQTTNGPGFGDTPDDGYAFFIGDPIYNIYQKAYQTLNATVGH